MVVFTPNFGSVQSHCLKPDCDRTFLHRHHIRHEAVWIALNLRRKGPNEELGWTEEVIHNLDERYHKFLPKDIARICAWHHAEIHMLYDLEAEKFQRRLKYKPYSQFSYKEATRLMNRFEKTFNLWLPKHTPGVDPNYLRPFRNFPLLKEELK